MYHKAFNVVIRASVAHASSSSCTARFGLCAHKQKLKKA